MSTLIVPSLVISVSTTPLELHYLDEYSLFVVFMNEIMYVLLLTIFIYTNKLVQCAPHNFPFSTDLGN